MNSGEPLGTVAALWRFPVKSMLGEELDAAGDGVQVGVAIPDPRCCMPSLAQEDLPRDPQILKALARHNRLDVGGSMFPCAGVYAVAAATGVIRRADPVSLV